MALMWLLASVHGLTFSSYPRRAAPPSMATEWRSSLALAPVLGSWQDPVDAAIESLAWPEDAPDPDLVMLVMPRAHASSLQQACAQVARVLRPGQLLGVVGAGAIGGKEEVDTDSAVSILAGVFPAETTLTPFVLAPERMPVWSQLSPGDGDRPAFLLLADPFSAVTQAAAALDDAFPSAVVAGGLSCPTSDSVPSLALGSRGAQCRTLPVGSVLGLSIRGPNVEVHTACAQGATPLGPSYEVTSCRENLVLELDGRPAIERLTEVAQGLQGDERMLKLMRSALLVGVHFPEGEDDGDDERAAAAADVPSLGEKPVDFLIRQVLGSEQSGGIYLGELVRPGMQLRFHVRDELAAQEDLAGVLGRYKLQRQFTGRYSSGGAPKQPLAAFQFSCNGRGSNMYSEKNYDSSTFSAVVSDAPSGGFFCNGELAPVGAAGLSNAGGTTHLHGFTSVWAMVYDTS